VSLKLMYITNDVTIAQIAQKAGVDWIFIDLEIKGKLERQKNMDTVISMHSISDILPIRNVLNQSKLLVRINPINEDSEQEIEKVISSRADIIMLPFFKTKEEVETFIKFVNNRAQTCLLLETPEAVDNIDDILSLNGIDFIHIGLNDLHLAYKKKFMFELLADGTVEYIVNKLKDKNIEYGFGGIARLSDGLLPSEYIIAEHYRLGSSMAILSRTFFNQKNINSYNSAYDVFINEVKKIRVFESTLNSKNIDFFIDNKQNVAAKVNEIIQIIKG